jgi:hypothetical protein
VQTTTSKTAAAHGLQRPRFFARQLVTPAELNLGLDYVLERLRVHNRLLHGCGVVCGLKVCRVKGSDDAALPWKVAIEPGHAIDCCGNDLTVDCERVVDLRSVVTVSACGDPAGEVRDPWCADTWTEREGGRVWIAVCYAACRTRPVRTQPAGCGCNDTDCEYSRWVDGYEVRVLDEAPESCTEEPPSWEDFLGTLAGMSRARGGGLRRRRQHHRDRQLLVPADGLVACRLLVALRRRGHSHGRQREHGWAVHAEDEGDQAERHRHEPAR